MTDTLATATVVAASDRARPRGPARPISGSAPGYREDIQGLRAVAVALVVLYHAGLPLLPGGYIGVDVFFVISGFLITGQLTRSLYRHGTISLADFYARRIRRLLPMSLLTTLITLAAGTLFLPALRIPGLTRDAIASALYVPNLLFAHQGTDYLAETAPSPFQHYWSLGVEEQFYLLWPLYLLLAWRIARRLRRGRAAALPTGAPPAAVPPAVLPAAVLAAVGVSFTVSLWATTTSPPWAFFSMPTRIWELGLGALVAVNPLRPRPRHAPGRLAVTATGWAGLTAILAAAMRFDAGTPFPGWRAAVPTLGAAAIILAGGTVTSRTTGTATGRTTRRPTGRTLGRESGAHAAPGRSWAPAPVGRTLALAPLQLLGRISYSIYLLHWPLLVIPSAAGGGWGLSLPARLALAAATVPLALASYRWIEQPGRRWQRLHTVRTRRIVLGAILSSALVAGLCLLSLPIQHAKASSTTHTAAPYTPAIPPTFTPFVPANLTPSLTGAAQSLPVLYPDGCHASRATVAVQHCTFGTVTSPVTVALVGDSHAAQWFPALDRWARTAGVRLQAFTKSDCPAASVDVLASDGAPYPACSRWRTAVLRELQDHPPALAVLAGRGASLLADGHTGAARQAEWDAGLTRTITELPATTRVVVMADTPAFPGTPAICLSAHLDNALACARPRSQALDAAWAAAERATTTAAGGSYLDLNHYHFTRTTCGVIIGNLLAYRDKHHLTAAFSAALTGPLERRLPPVRDLSHLPQSGGS